MKKNYTTREITSRKVTYLQIIILKYVFKPQFRFNYPLNIPQTAHIINPEHSHYSPI